jgi:hypothetical protein
VRKILRRFAYNPAGNEKSSQKGGENITMWKGTNSQGKPVTLLNPAEKSRKYAKEIKDNRRYTNDGRLKTDKAGTPLSLDEKQRSYRAGYLDSRSDNAKAYCRSNGVKSKAQPRKRTNKSLRNNRGGGGNFYFG